MLFVTILKKVVAKLFFGRVKFSVCLYVFSIKPFCKICGVGGIKCIVCAENSFMHIARKS